METIVNWGRLTRDENTLRIVFAEEAICPSEQAAAQLAAALMLTLTNGNPSAVALDFYVSATAPSTTIMAPDNCAFVQVRLNDGTTKADFMGVPCSEQAEALGFQSDRQMLAHEIWLKDHKKPGYSSWLAFSKVLDECRKAHAVSYTERLNMIGLRLGRLGLIHLLPEILHACFPEQVVVNVIDQLDAESKRLLMAELVSEI